MCKHTNGNDGQVWPFERLGLVTNRIVGERRRQVRRPPALRVIQGGAARRE